MSQTVEIDTWICPDCGYKQDFDPDDAQLMWLHFPGSVLGMCPACSMGISKTTKKQRIRKHVRMGKAINPDDMTKVEVATDGEIDAYGDVSQEDKEKFKEKAKASRQKYNIS